MSEKEKKENPQTIKKSEDSLKKDSEKDVERLTKPMGDENAKSGTRGG